MEGVSSLLISGASLSFHPSSLLSPGVWTSEHNHGPAVEGGPSEETDVLCVLHEFSVGTPWEQVCCVKGQP